MSFVRRALRRGAASGGAVLASVLLAGCAGDYPQTTFRPVTDFARQTDALFHYIFWLTVGILVIVEVVLFYVIVRYRDRPGAEAKQIHGNNKLEVAWTIAPAIIVVLIIVPTVRTIFRSYELPPKGALTVEAIGHQWWWEFKYPQYGPNARTSNQLYLPVGRPVEIVTSSADVIHSWWVPRLSGKRDAFPIPALPPGATPPTRYHHLVFTVDSPGVYWGQCAEYCGAGHALMQMRVVAVSQDSFATMVHDFVNGTPAQPAGAAPATTTAMASVAPLPAGQAKADSAKAAAPARPGAPPEGTEARKGYDIFMTHACVACHRIAGTPAIGRIGPDLTLVGLRWAIGAGTLKNSPADIEKWVTDPGAVKQGAKMPGVKVPGGGIPPTGLTPTQVAAVAAYLSSLK